MATLIYEMEGKSTWAASFDIGYRNFAFCVEEYDAEMLTSLPKIAKADRFNPDGTLTEDFGDVVEKACLNGKVVLFRNIDLTGGRKIESLDMELFHAMTDVLDEYTEYWDKCESFIVEMQMSFRGVYNVKALKLGQHCLSYFALKYGRDKYMVEYPAFNKTEVLGAQKICKGVTKKGKTTFKSMDKPARKKWSVVKACEILELRGEDETLSGLTTKKKKDDLADTLLQLCSWKILHYIDGSV